MPIVFEHSDSDGTYKLAVWKSGGSEAESDLTVLSPAETAEYRSFKSTGRKREFLAVRWLVRQLAGRTVSIRYDNNGAPRLDDGRPLSITHSGDCVGVMIGHHGRVGIDLETIRGNIGRIAPKFISAAEHSAFGEQLHPEAMHVIWCAKEILFKIYRKGGIDFRKDLQVKSTAVGSYGTVEATIRKPDLSAMIRIHYRILNGFVLAWGRYDE